MRKIVALKWLDWLIRGLLVLVLSIVVLVLATLVILAVLVAFKMLIAAYSADGGSTENTTLALSSLGLGALVVALLSAPLIIWRSWIAHQDYKVNKQGHITDRINKAVEGLGAEKTIYKTIRYVEYEIGGVPTYSIEDMDASFRVNSSTCQVESMSTGEWQAISKSVPNLEVRIGAIYALERIAQDSLRDHIQIMEILCAYIRENAPVAGALSFNFFNEDLDVFPRTDIQVALTVIGRRNKEGIKLERQKKYKLDLTKINLQGVTLIGNFDHAVFDDTDFSRAMIIHAQISYTSFVGTKLESANLYETCFRNIRFDRTNFSYAYLALVSFQNVSFVNELPSYSGTNMYNLTQEQVDFTFGDGSVSLPNHINRPQHWPTEKLGDKFEKAYKKWIEEISF